MKRSSFLKALAAIPFGAKLVNKGEKSPYNGESIKHGSKGYWIKMKPGTHQMSASSGLWIPGEDVRKYPLTPSEACKSCSA